MSPSISATEFVSRRHPTGIGDQRQTIDPVRVVAAKSTARPPSEIPTMLAWSNLAASMTVPTSSVRRSKVPTSYSTGQAALVEHCDPALLG
jgi:hypothetical protein